jgi:hypothetical protein
MRISNAIIDIAFHLMGKSSKRQHYISLGLQLIPELVGDSDHCHDTHFGCCVQVGHHAVVVLSEEYLFLEEEICCGSIITKSTILSLNTSRWSHEWRRSLGSRLWAKGSDAQGKAKWNGAILSWLKGNLPNLCRKF